MDHYSFLTRLHAIPEHWFLHAPSEISDGLQQDGVPWLEDNVPMWLLDFAVLCHAAAAESEEAAELDDGEEEDTKARTSLGELHSSAFLADLKAGFEQLRVRLSSDENTDLLKTELQLDLFYGQTGCFLRLLETPIDKGTLEFWIYENAFFHPFSGLTHQRMNERVLELAAN